MLFFNKKDKKKEKPLQKALIEQLGDPYLVKYLFDFLSRSDGISFASTCKTLHNNLYRDIVKFEILGIQVKLAKKNDTLASCCCLSTEPFHFLLLIFFSIVTWHKLAKEFQLPSQSFLGHLVFFLIFSFLVALINSGLVCLSFCCLCVDKDYSSYSSSDAVFYSLFALFVAAVIYDKATSDLKISDSLSSLTASAFFISTLYRLFCSSSYVVAVA